MDSCKFRFMGVLSKTAYGENRTGLLVVSSYVSFFFLTSLHVDNVGNSLKRQFIFGL